MIRTWIFAGMAALGYGMLAGTDTETMQHICTYLRETPNSACGFQDAVHGLGALMFAGGGTALAGNLIGAPAQGPSRAGLELLTDAIVGYFVVSSQWWTDNVTHML